MYCGDATRLRCLRSSLRIYKLRYKFEAKYILENNWFFFHLHFQQVNTTKNVCSVCFCCFQFPNWNKWLTLRSWSAQQHGNSFELFFSSSIYKFQITFFTSFMKSWKNSLHVIYNYFTIILHKRLNYYLLFKQKPF